MVDSRGELKELLATNNANDPARPLAVTKEDRLPPLSCPGHGQPPPVRGFVIDLPELPRRSMTRSLQEGGALLSRGLQGDRQTRLRSTVYSCWCSPCVYSRVRVWHPPCLAPGQVHPRPRFATPPQREPVQQQIGPQGQVGQPGGTWTCGGPRSVAERFLGGTLPVGRVVRRYGCAGAELAQESKIPTSSSTNAGCCRLRPAHDRRARFITAREWLPQNADEGGPDTRLQIGTKP
jgi:hypothetical protein